MDELPQHRDEGILFSQLYGLFFTDIFETPRFTIGWSKLAADPYSNLAGQLNCRLSDLPAVVRDISTFFAAQSRAATICVTPFSQPSELPVYLQELGYKLAYQEAWMYLSEPVKALTIPAWISIRSVQSPAAMRLYVDLFNRAYSGHDPREPYGQAPPEWGETLYASFGMQRPGRKVEYYILFDQEQPASVLLTASIAGSAGIYSVGTVPEMRGRGYGSLITLFAVDQLRQAGNSEVFLQTEQGSYNERLYTKLGFCSKWIAQGWTAESAAGRTHSPG